MFDSERNADGKNEETIRSAEGKLAMQSREETETGSSDADGFRNDERKRRILLPSADAVGLSLPAPRCRSLLMEYRHLIVPGLPCRHDPCER